MARHNKRGSGSGRKRKGSQAVTSLNKKQKKHLKEFGELHPADVRDTGKERYQKVSAICDIPKNEAVYSSEDEEEPKTSYEDLLCSVRISQERYDDDRQIGSEGEEEEEEDDENDEQKDDDGGELENKVACGKLQQDTTSAAAAAAAVALDEQEERLNEEDDDDEEDSTGEDGESGLDEDSIEVESDVGEEPDEVALKETDPFHQHFEHDLEDSLATSLMNQEEPWKKEPLKVSELGRCVLSLPQRCSSSAIKDIGKDLRQSHVKQQLCLRAATSNTLFTSAQLSDKEYLTTFQSSLFSIINNYQDLMFPARTHTNGEQIRFLYCLHALNHVLKTRSRVIAHNAKIKAKGGNLLEDYRDQGLTRPKVLIVLPFKEAALRVVRIMSSLLMSDEQSHILNKKRFYAEFEPEVSDEQIHKKGEDYAATFAGNIDDHFRIGLGIAKKSLRLYAEFYSSDVIIASPLGLRTIIGAEGEEQRDFDFLSSIEILIFDQMDTLFMQNWDHVLHLMSHMHRQPSSAHGVDFSRVRMCSLNGWSKLYRQTLLFSSVTMPEVLSLFNKQCHNYTGKVCSVKSDERGSICQVVSQLPQMFHKIQVDSFVQLADARLEFFKTKILPQFKDDLMSRTMIFIPSYFDFVRLRNYFKKEELDTLHLCEYSKNKHISRTRTYFFHGNCHFLLYTERFHFYRRYKIRGARHLIFYELPLYPHFYSDLCNNVQERPGEEVSCTVLYSSYDGHKLAAVVGTDRAKHMLQSDKSVHMFVSGET